VLVTDYQNNMSTESTEPSTTTPPGPMSTTSREVEEPATKKAAKSKSKTKAKKSIGAKSKRRKSTAKNTQSKKKTKARRRAAK
jgi:hypothetical protein